LSATEDTVNTENMKTNTAMHMPALESYYRGDSTKIEYKVI